MRISLVHQIPPSENNPRNSEGAFIRSADGEILFAYSCYYGNSSADHAPCNIALIRSRDEGITWTQPEIIASADFFGTQNIMSVSALYQENGDIAFYFLIKEPDFSSTIGRVVSADGRTFSQERCKTNFPPAYYVINNDRFVRLRNGRIAAPAAYISMAQNKQEIAGPYTSVTTCLISDDDGKSFYKANFDFVSEDPLNADCGYQEPGILEKPDGSLYLWMRTNYGCQYESYSDGNMDQFSRPRPSPFTSPVSPMQMKIYDGIVYTIYNPIPNYNGRVLFPGTWGRTPLVIRKSTDNGMTFGPLQTIEDDPQRGYCYPSLFRTRDGHFLVAYCRGSQQDGNTLCRLGISRMQMDSIQ